MLSHIYVYVLCSQVGNYKRAVKRFDDGHRLCNDLMGCLQERAKIEKSYGDQLTAWSKRWRQLIEKGQLVGMANKINKLKTLNNKST